MLTMLSTSTRLPISHDTITMANPAMAVHIYGLSFIVNLDFYWFYKHFY